jgi:uncharacterized membrane protein
MSIPQPEATKVRTVAAVPVRRARGSVLPPAIVCVMGMAYGLLFGWLTLRRYWGFLMHAQDMGNMGQAAWNTIHGHPFFFTNVRLPWNMEAWGTTTRLSFHVEPIFPLISLVYFIRSTPESLIVLQTVALALGVIPVYLLARDVFGSQWFGVLFALVYALYPSVEAMNEYEFHPVSLATPLLLAAFLFAYRRQWAAFAVAALLAMGTKEEIGLVVGFLGLYVAFFLHERRIGLWTAGAGIFWSLFAVFVVEKHFRPPGSLTYLHSRYGYLQGTDPKYRGLHGIIHTVHHDPGYIAMHILIWPKAGYLWLLLVPVGLLALLAPEVALIGLPTLGLNLLSYESAMYSGLGDNSAELIAVLLVAAIIGGARLARWVRPYLGPRLATASLAAYLALMSVGSQIAYGFTPLGPNYVVAPIGTHQRIEQRFVDMVPSGVPVATQDQLDPHLSSRHYLYLFGDTGRSPLLAPANDVVLDVSADTYAYTSPDIYGRAQTLLRSGWGVVAADDGLIYLRKGVKNTTIPQQFYSWVHADDVKPQHALTGVLEGLKLVGLDVGKSDQPNHTVPVLNFSVFLRPDSDSTPNVMPVIWEMLPDSLPNCATEHGLEWLPTTQWKADRIYRVNMQGLETDTNIPGNVPLYLSIERYSTHLACGDLWANHQSLTPIGSVSVST